MRFELALILVLAFVVYGQEKPTDTPSEPIWPAKFTTKFDEVFNYPLVGEVKTKGSFYYNYNTKRYRVDRENGKGDRYCGLNGLKWLKNTPCSQYVVNGDRYIYYPELKECCYCCSSEHGCGILHPQWHKGAEFLGVVSYQGREAFKWDKPGLQSNFYYETLHDEPQNRIMLGIDQKPNDHQIFDPAAWSTEFNDAVLELPSICKKSNSCSIASTCTAARNI